MSTDRKVQMIVESLHVAYAVSLCLNEEPGNLSFNQPALRQHLIHCLEAGEFTSFPVLNLKRRQGFKVNSRQLVKVYCTCRLPKLSEIPMICCSNCSWMDTKECLESKKREMVLSCLQVLIQNYVRDEFRLNILSNVICKQNIQYVND